MLIMFILTITTQKKGNSKQFSKFDIHFKKCTLNTCDEYRYDESCALKCVSNECFNQVYGEDDILEFGEVNLIKRSKFEQCFYKNN